MSDFVNDGDELDREDEVTQSVTDSDGDVGSAASDSPVSWDEIMSGDESGSSLEHDGVDDSGALVSRLRVLRWLACWRLAACTGGTIMMMLLSRLRLPRCLRAWTRVPRFRRCRLLVVWSR